MQALTDISSYSWAGLREFGICVHALPLASLAHLQHRQERFLRNIHAADALHALLAFFLFLQQLALADDVAAVALGEDVLADGAARFRAR